MPTTRMHAKTTLLLALVALALVLPAAQGKTFEVPLYLHDNPLHAAPEVVNAAVGDQIVLTVVNQGSSPHNLVVCGDGAGSSGSTCQDVWARTPMLQPNQEATLNFTVAEAGTFEYYCDIPGHKAGGMAGRLVVAGDAAEKKTPLPGAPAALLALAALALLLHRRT